MSTGRYIARGRGRAAACKCGVAQGITLVELLVVLTILGLMAAVAIPTFAKFGFFSRNETQQGARELYKVLSAARVLAATYRVNTALAYGIAFNKTDSLTGQLVTAIDSYALVQKLPADCHLIYNDVEVTGDELKPAFVPVTGVYESGTFTSLPQDTAVLTDATFPDGKSNDLGGSTELIRIYRGEYDPSGKHYYAKERLTQADGTVDFPAHIFTPSGRMEWSNSDNSNKERREIRVGYSPDADPVERFVDPGNAAAGLRTIEIELYRGTGRVQIVREES